MKDIRYYLLQALPRAPREALVGRWCRRRCGEAALEYPQALRHVRAVLMVLPDDVLDALYQVENVLAIKEHFSEASVTFLCASEVAEYYHSIVADASFIEYTLSERHLFSKVLAHHAAALAREHFQICALLETQPDLALLNLVGLSGARVRVGYEHAAQYPFLNHIVRPREAPCFLAQRYGAMARSLGAPTAHRARLTAGKEASHGVERLLSDINVNQRGALVCIDCYGMAQHYGREWTATLLSALAATLPAATLCCPARHGSDEATAQWLAARGVAVVPPLSVARLAALLAHCALAVASHAPMLRLAALLERPSIGVIPAHLHDRHIQPGATVRSVSFKAAPDEHTVAATVRSVRELLPGGAP